MAHLAAIDLDGARLPSSTVIPVRNQGTVVVVHPDRVDPSVGGNDSWHLLPSTLEKFAVDYTSKSTESESEPEVAA